MKSIIAIGFVCIMLIYGCSSVGTMRTNSMMMPVVILEYSDGMEEWGRILRVDVDSLYIRRIDDLQPVTVDPDDVVCIYRVERRSANYPLCIAAGALVMGGAWGTVSYLNDGDTSSGSMLLAGAAGLIPATFAAVKVADWTRKYRIIPMDAIGTNGKLDLKRLDRSLGQF